MHISIIFREKKLFNLVNNWNRHILSGHLHHWSVQKRAKHYYFCTETNFVRFTTTVRGDIFMQHLAKMWDKWEAFMYVQNLLRHNFITVITFIRYIYAINSIVYARETSDNHFRLFLSTTLITFLDFGSYHYRHFHIADVHRINLSDNLIQRDELMPRQNLCM